MPGQLVPSVKLSVGLQAKICVTHTRTTLARPNKRTCLARTAWHCAMLLDHVTGTYTDSCTDPGLLAKPCTLVHLRNRFRYTIQTRELGRIGDVLAGYSIKYRDTL